MQGRIMSDVTVTDGGSIILLQPNTPEAESWIEDNIGQDNGFQPYWPTATCEHRYADDIIDGMMADGLTVD